MRLTRRQLIGSTSAGISLLAWPRCLLADSPEEPHYILQVVFQGGWDPSYFCDARPLAMTAAGRMQNYLGEEPQALRGARGGQTLMTSLFKPLLPFFQDGDLLIANGVHMAATSPGHEQNMNFLFTGTPFGGDSFIPYLNRRAKGVSPKALDALQLGVLRYDTAIANLSASVTMETSSAAALSQTARNVGPLNPSEAGMMFFQERLGRYADGQGRFSQGIRQMRDGFSLANELATRIRDVDLSSSDAEDALNQKLVLMHQYFACGISKSCILTVEAYELDTHDAGTAHDQIFVYRDVVADMAKVLQYLTATPLSPTDSRSLLDVTTVLFTSEFGRTMRQERMPIDATGTDHNPMTNSILIAGKNVRGGQIVGASDQATVEAPVSGAHRQLDPKLLSIMGLPFDFDCMGPSQELPDSYAPEHYLSFGSIVNTLMHQCGVPEDSYWAVSQGGAKARLLTGIFS